MHTHFTARLLSSAAAGALLLGTLGCGEKDNADSPPAKDSAATGSTMSQELNENQKIHRSLGYAIGSDLMLQSYSQDEVDQILAGLQLASAEEKPEYVEEHREQAFQILNEKASRRAQERQDSAIVDNKAAGEAFLKTIDGKEGITKTDSGLRYEILKEGSDKFATAEDSVNVHYHGTLTDGTVFDSSVDRGEPVTFPLNGVIPGFSEGLRLVGEGGKIRLYMPSDIAYGDRGAGGAIGPGATLIFECELLKINP